MDCVLDVDPVSDVGQVQGHEEAVPSPEGTPQHTVISAPLLQSHVSLRPQGQNYPRSSTSYSLLFPSRYFSSIFETIFEDYLYN